MKFDLLSIDLDGTLLTPVLAKTTNRDAKAIQKYLSLGGKICINTGRCAFSAYNFINKINSLGPNKIQFFSAYNGGYIHDFIDNKVYCKIIPHDLVKQLYDLVVKHDAFIWVHSVRGEKKKVIETNKLTFRFFIRLFRSFTLVKIKDFNNLEAYKVNLYSPFYKKAKALIDECHKLKLDKKVTFCMSGKKIVEITAKGTSKGVALSFFSKKYKIKQEKIMSIGDSFNDKSAFDLSGHTVGVKPKLASFHKHCDTIIKHKRYAITKIINDLICQENSKKK